jgi:hypothetical protein
VDAKLEFYHWMAVEQGAGTTAWDGGIVLISSGDGNWTQVYPLGGYPYTIIDNPASPFEPDTPCYSGSFGWSQAVFDLAAYSGVVQLMFRFGSDGAVAYEGWYVDDFLVGNTLAGPDVSVEPSSEVALSFPLVTQSGTTTVTSGPSGPGVPSGYVAVPTDPITYYDVSTDAVYEGSIDVCIAYDEADVEGDETALKLLHYSGGEWTDVTQTVDTDADLVCGQVSSLSPFLVATEYTSCCLARVGDANGAGGDEPTIGDVTVMIDALFIGEDWSVVACLPEADINQSGGSDPQTSDITIGDVSYLIDYLFIAGPTGTTLPDCL